MKGVNTVIMEGIVSLGGGLASFLYILTDWEKELGKETEMLGYLKILGMDASYGLSNLYEDYKFCYDGLIVSDKNTSTKITIDSANFFKGAVLFLLSVFEDEGPCSNRLVPQYPLSEWGEEPAFLPDSQSLNQFMKEVISETIKEQEAANTKENLNLNSNANLSAPQTQAIVDTANLSMQNSSMKTNKLEVSTNLISSQDTNLTNTPETSKRQKGGENLL
jgi:hypothetical protein